jgi:CheY-like chemotaxis protein
VCQLAIHGHVGDCFRTLHRSIVHAAKYSLHPHKVRTKILVAQVRSLIVSTGLNGLHNFILLDMQMPKLDGYQTAKGLRQIGYREPIMALTADAMHGDMKRCIDAGCNDYLSKPIDKNVLLRKVRTHLASPVDRSH